MKHGGFNAAICFKITGAGGESSCSVAASRRITGQLHKSSTGSYVLPLTGPGDEHKGGEVWITRAVTPGTQLPPCEHPGPTKKTNQAPCLLHSLSLPPSLPPSSAWQHTKQQRFPPEGRHGAAHVHTCLTWPVMNQMWPIGRREN